MYQSNFSKLIFCVSFIFIIQSYLLSLGFLNAGLFVACLDATAVRWTLSLTRLGVDVWWYTGDRPVLARGPRVPQNHAVLVSRRHGPRRQPQQRAPCRSLARRLEAFLLQHQSRFARHGPAPALTTAFELTRLKNVPVSPNRNTIKRYNSLALPFNG